ncbi:DUF72 domain-containing protein [Thermogladius sp. 4427co]|uniref:DUF72 domain-containing protein n=1 Tax=Thermogladius sp. 4427co TaxID=3450718 RepID=UPI003F7ADC35
MEIYVGTSGWLYDWNEEATLDWYIRESGLNTVELNASFYRFPFRNQVLSWARKGSSIKWAVKVHQSITHRRKFGEGSLDIWFKFRDLFQPLDKYVEFYLFQLPPNLSCKKENLDKIEKFYENTGLGERFAIEFRNPTCFNNDIVEWGRSLGLTIVSIDAPIATWIAYSSRSLYLRLHGHLDWYGYEYSEGELAEIADKVISLKPQRVFVYFNNNHYMLENARTMKKILEARVSGGIG